MNELQVLNNSKTLDSREVAEMMGMDHSRILRMLEGDESHVGIIPTLTEAQLGASKNFIESSYKGRNGENKCYQVTKKGCEILGNRLQGKKGILFTARYVERFNQMEQALKELQPTPSYMIEDPIERAKVWITEQEKLQAEQEKVKQLGEENKANKPKVIFADAVAGSDDSILVGDLSKLLNQNGIDIGQNRLFEWLRKNNYLISRKGTSYNKPTQKSMDLGVFECKERTIIGANGKAKVGYTPLVTGKGQQYFINKFLNNKEEQ